MKYAIVIMVHLLLYTISYAQEQENIIAALEQHAAIVAENDGIEREDDSYLLQWENLKKHPINLNLAGADELKQLPQLNALQIENFITYRRLFGNLLDLYELQAVPTWNISLIKQLLPFITVSQSSSIKNVKEQWNSGTHMILLRSSFVLEKSAGYKNQTDSGSRFLGSAGRLMFRYNYNYKNQLHWGLSGDKDAGEQFFKGTQSTGFDFYSFHFFLSKPGIVRSLAIGDFTINMGQGLIHWQSLAFSKSPEIASVKRQSAVLRPYTATGEINFHRGVGITLQQQKWQSTLFVSVVKLSGNLVKDSATDIGHISSILSSGYHRTPGELEDRNNLQQLSAGINVRYATEKLQFGLNAVGYKFSLPLKKDDKPYNLYAAKGDRFINMSADYSYTYKNFHLFGEFAADAGYHTALSSGVLASVSQTVDLSVVYRSIDKKYRAFNANAFTENADPNNEKGLYAGIAVRPSDKIELHAYTDHFNFPWLKYRVDAPSFGSEYFAGITYTPNKLVSLYCQFRSGQKQQNITGNIGTTNLLENITKQNLRIHAAVKLNQSLSLRSRVETSVYNKNKTSEEHGFLLFTDIAYHPVLKPWSLNMRLEYFETEGYNSRLYSYENDVLYSFSIPSVFDKGYRYYINLSCQLKSFIRKSIPGNPAFWVRFAQTVYDDKLIIGSGIDKINGNKKSELKFQLTISF